VGIELEAARMSDVSELFVQKSRALLTGDYLPKIERSLAPLTEDDVWWRPNPASNSIGNLVLHLAGNVTQWILGGVAGRSYVRTRQQEFDERTPSPKSDLLARLSSVVVEADGVIAALTPAALTERRQIQRYDVSVLEAVYHVVEHFGMHTGQIIMISKTRSAKDLGLWQPPPA
jgi:hypothetical protein